MDYRFLSAFILSISAFAAQPEFRSQSLKQLAAEALRRNPEILAAQKRYEAARQRPDAASSLPDPMFSAGYSSAGRPWLGAGIGTEPTANVGFMVSQEFPFPGKRKLRGDIAQKEAQGEFEQYQSVELSVLARLRKAWHELHHAYAMIEVLERNRELQKRFLAVTESRYSIGKAMQPDLFRIQTQLTLLETKIVRMEQEKRSREAQINSLLLRPLGTPIARPEDIPAGEFTIKLEELFAGADKNSPMLKRDKKMIERSESALNLARKEYYPDYTLGAGYFNMGSMPAMYQFRMDIKIPAYFWRRQRAEVSEQSYMLSQSKRQYEATGQNLLYRIKDDFLMAQASHKLTAMYQDTVIPQASLTLESSLPAYQTGSGDFLSVLMNLTMILDAEEAYHTELVNYHLALIRLEEMTGLKLIED
jgi:outer membrane protein TolC